MIEDLAHQKATGKQSTDADDLREHRLIPLNLVRELVSLSTSKIYELMGEGSFPRQIKLSEQRVAWRLRDVLEWINSKAQESDTDASDRPGNRNDRSTNNGR